ncbi:MAG: GNAT family N-acetyltransferase [Flavobacteriaceae bacterium]|nr:GNAT family N-acetyltransferase [Flavobacteriaceae bacterium]
MLQIKLANNIEDFRNIEDLAKEIWEEHYTPIIGPDQVAYMLNKFQSAVAIKNQIDDEYQYFQVYIDDISVGYFSFIKRDTSLFLSKIYVLKKYRGKGVGKFMMDFVLQKAMQLNLISIVLTVNKENKNSIEAYEKMGFQNMGSLVADIGNGFVMDDNKMIKSLIY